MTRTAECLTCGATFRVIERHPMITNESWCDACLSILRPLWLDVGLVPAIPSNMTADRLTRASTDDRVSA